MSKVLRRIAAVLLAVMMVFSVVPIMSLAADKEIEKEQIIDNYLNKFSKWKLDTTSYTGVFGAGYLFLDVDFDNDLELISFITAGSGRNTSATIYDQLSDGRILEYEWSSYGAHDFYSDSFHLELYYYKKENRYIYISTDFTYLSGSSAIVYSEMYGTGYSIKEKPLYGESNDRTGAIEYTIYPDGSYKYVSKSEYDDYYNKYYSEKVNCHLEYEIIAASSFNNASNSSKRAMLLDSYRAFSYDKNLKIYANSDDGSYSVGQTVELYVVQDDGETKIDPKKITVSVANSDSKNTVLGTPVIEKNKMNPNAVTISFPTYNSGNCVVTINNNLTGEDSVCNIKVFDNNLPPICNMSFSTKIYKCGPCEEVFNYYYNEMYIADGKASFNKTSKKWNVSFNVFNQSNMIGLVQVYDDKGNLIDADIINKYTSSGTDFTDTFMNFGYLLYDAAKDVGNYIINYSEGFKWSSLSFRDPIQSEQTSIEIEVPENGYFIITNSVLTSKLCSIVNDIDILLTSASIVKGFVDLAESQNENVEKEVLIELIHGGYIPAIINDFKEDDYEDLIHFGINEVAISSTIGNCSNNLLRLFKDIDFDFFTVVKRVDEKIANMTSSAISAAGGIAGVALESGFAFIKATNLICQLMDMSLYLRDNGMQLNAPKTGDETLLCTENASIETYGNVDGETILTSYRVLSDEVDVKLEDGTAAGDMTVYDVTLWKNGTETQPDGKVRVYLTLPDGYDPDKIIIAKEADDGWEYPSFYVDNGMIVIDVDHFCKFAIMRIGEVKSVRLDDVEFKYKTLANITPNIVIDDGVKYTVTYESSNPSVATVDKDGNITTLHKGDTTIICTVTDEFGNVVKDTCTVTVKFSFGQWLIWILLLGFLWY